MGTNLNLSKQTAKQTADVMASIERMTTAQTSVEAFKALYEHFRHHSKATNPKGQAADAKYGTSKISVTFRRNVPMKNGIVTMNFRDMFDALMLNGGVDPKDLATVWQETVEAAATEGYRLDRIPGFSTVVCGPDVPVYVQGDSVSAEERRANKLRSMFR